MSGLVFFKTEKLEQLKMFYRDRLDADLWKDQGDCLIFEKNGFRFGFCSREETENCGVLTFVFDNKEEVDKIYEDLDDLAKGKPVSRKPDYEIYQFFARDPEERTLEFQCFLDE
jgi:hypothetical protein